MSLKESIKNLKENNLPDRHDHLKDHDIFKYYLCCLELETLTAIHMTIVNPGNTAWIEEQSTPDVDDLINRISSRLFGINNSTLFVTDPDQTTDPVRPASAPLLTDHKPLGVNRPGSAPP